MKKILQILLTLSLALLLTLTPSLLQMVYSETPLQPAQERATPENKIDGSPVVIDGETVWLVRDGIAGFSAEDRAKAITSRLERIAQDNSINLKKLTIRIDSGTNLTYLSLDNEVILTVTPQDAKASRTSEEKVAKQAKEKITTVLQQYRKLRKPAQLLRGVIYAVLSTFALLIVLSFFTKVNRAIFPPAKNWIKSRIPGIRIKQIEFISSSNMVAVIIHIFELIRLFILLIISYIYIHFVLSSFPWTMSFSQRILNYILQTLNLGLNEMAKYLPNVLTIAIIIGSTRYIIQLIKPFFKSLETGSLVIDGFYTDWAKPTYSLLSTLIIALAAVVAFPYIPGFDSPSFQGISVFIGVLFSLGSTSAISNVVGGIILIYTRAFQVGDRVQVGDIIGIIIEKNFLATRLNTITNQVITIPNSSLLNSNVINFSVSLRELNEPLIIQTTITLGYDLPWRKVHAILIEAALSTKHILKERTPFVIQTSLDDFYVSYQLNAYINEPNLIVTISSELHQNIQDKCNEVGIEIMSPHYSSIRDGNQTTIPENYLPDDYTSPGFRISSKER